jgi:hypothetical protein
MMIRPHLIIMIKSRRMRRTRQIACMVRRGIRTGFWWESQKEIDQQEDLDVGGKITLKLILEKEDRVI